jgi:hypothetical protein
MSGERIDYSIERQRHEAFVGRAALLARLDQLLIADRTDRWVVVTGGPGMGKSAMLAAWLARREAAGAVVPHHFIRRGEYDWDDPAKLVSSLVAQIEARFPDQREPAEGAPKHPAARLVAALTRVSATATALARRERPPDVPSQGLLNVRYLRPVASLPGLSPGLSEGTTPCFRYACASSQLRNCGSLLRRNFHSLGCTAFLQVTPPTWALVRRALRTSWPSRRAHDRTGSATARWRRSPTPAAVRRCEVERRCAGCCRRSC